jgi:deoxyribodipyrimidine photo-lyase
MLDITTFFSKNEYVTIYQPRICNPERKYVLYWMQRAQRGYQNAALNAAIVLGNALDLPIIVVFVITDFGAANLPISGKSATGLSHVGELPPARRRSKRLTSIF